MTAVVLQSSSQARLQELRQRLEQDYGNGCVATVIVQDESGRIVQFMSGSHASEIEAALHKYQGRP